VAALLGGEFAGSTHQPGHQALWDGGVRGRSGVVRLDGRTQPARLPGSQNAMFPAHV
jgi:hypothetical protein